MKTILLLLATAGTLLGCFIPPTENAQLFRRDALKLDTNRQILLSKDLLTLATRPTALANTAQRRATAQLLALAANFDPDSKTPRRIAKRFAAPYEDQATSVVDYNEPLENISRVVLYLLEDSQEKEHFAIAQLLLDPLATIAPDQGIVSARPSTKGSPRWYRAIAPLESFATPKKEPSPEIPKKEMATDSPIKTPEETFKKVADFKGAISIPLFLHENSNGKNNIHARLQALTFDAKLKEQPGQISRPFKLNSQILPNIIQRVQTNLHRKHDSQIVAGVQGKFHLNKAGYTDRNGLILALPMTILTEGLLSERQPIDNLVILGELTESGAIKAPEFPWQFLEILLASKSDEPRRLLVSPEIKPLLLSFLTQQNEDFFFQFDIFAVSTLDEAYELAFEGATPEKTTQAFTQFQEIRQVGAGKSTTAFVSNPHVIARLAEVEKTEPRYLSATLLKARGTGEYPQQHSTPALAAILQSALMPLAQIPYSRSRDLESDSLESIHKQCRANLDPLARHIAISDRKMYDNALDLANRVRTLARAKSRHDKEGHTGSDSFHLSLFFNTFKAIQEEYYELAKKTSTLLGQKPPTDPRLTKTD